MARVEARATPLEASRKVIARTSFAAENYRGSGARPWSLVGVGLLIVVSGNPAIFYFPKEAVLLLTLAFMIIAWLRRGASLSRSAKLVMAAFVTISIGHAWVFGPEVFASSAGFLVRLLIAMFAASTFSDFDDSFVDVMCVLASVSLIFHIPVLLGVDLADKTEALRIQAGWLTSWHIGIHNFMVLGDEHRNAGMFGEPGMFAGFIVLALLFGVTGRIRRPRTTWVILVVALITTLSTTGYVAGAAVGLIASFSVPTTRRLVKVLRVGAVVTIFALGASRAYEEVDFLGAKIESQFSEAAERTELSKVNRFGNFIYDMDHLAERPLIGWSPLPRTRSVVDREIEDLASGQGNGLSNFAVKFGVLGILVFFLCVYGSFKKRGAEVYTVFGACGVIAILLTGEPYLNAPAFMSLMFVARRSDA